MSMAFPLKFRANMMNWRRSILRREEQLKIVTRNCINHSIPRYADFDSPGFMHGIDLLIIKIFVLYFLSYFSRFMFLSHFINLSLFKSKVGFLECFFYWVFSICLFDWFLILIGFVLIDYDL